MKHLCAWTARVALSLFVCALVATAAPAQTEHPFSVEVGGGWTPPVGQLSNRLGNGWNVTGGAGWNASKMLNLGIKYQYNGFGVSSSVLNALGVPGGDAHVQSLTFDPRIELPFGQRYGAYAVGGVGYYWRTVNFTQPTTFTTTFFDPFFGVFFPGVVGANQVIGRVRRSGIGGSLGGGLNFGLGHFTSAKLFVEARYHYANTGNIPTRMVPVTVGLRW